jgi:hypothetical protein
MSNKNKGKQVKGVQSPDEMTPSQRELIILEKLELMNHRMNELAAAGMNSPRIQESSPPYRAPGQMQPMQQFQVQQADNGAQMLAFRQKVISLPLIFFYFPILYYFILFFAFCFSRMKVKKWLL